jgi:putative transcriptional regulator
MASQLKADIKKGKLLISKPLISDGNFHNTVVFLTEYSPAGVVGFIINKPLKLNLSDLVDGITKPNTTLYNGGPVDSDCLYYIHKAPNKIDGSIHIVNDLYWGGNIDQVIGLIKSGVLNSNEIRFFLGYSGWDSDQLNHEINSDSWFVDEIDQSLFECDLETLWINRLKSKSDSYKIWANAPHDISLN